MLPTTHTFPIASRQSSLAMVQAKLIGKMLFAMSDAANGGFKENFPILGLVSTGDKNLIGSLAEIGGKGLFTKEIEDALLDGRARFAVHSLKDMPAECPNGLVIAAIPPREDPRDAFISAKVKSPWELPEGGLLGTASVRRKAQTLLRRPDLNCKPLRGNVSTRLEKTKRGDVDGTFLAVAGLNRLGLQDEIQHVMEIDQMLPAVGQGALCVQAREDDDEALALAQKIACPVTTLCVTIERAFMAALDGSCKTPIAGYARVVGKNIKFDGEYLSLNGDSRNQVSRIFEQIPENFTDLSQDILRQAHQMGTQAALEIKKSVSLES